MPIKLNSLHDTHSLAKKFSNQSKVKDIITLSGELGSGKTEFARSFIRYCLGKKIIVPSPTFTLCQIYQTPKGNIWHFDLFRLTSFNETFEIGIEEAFNTGISLIEWPELIPKHLLINHLKLCFSIKNDCHWVKIKKDQSWEQRK